jgi:hypothetical protein
VTRSWSGSSGRRVDRLHDWPHGGLEGGRCDQRAHDYDHQYHSVKLASHYPVARACLGYAALDVPLLGIPSECLVERIPNSRTDAHHNQLPW